jgi:hypothetical protein
MHAVLPADAGIAPCNGLSYVRGATDVPLSIHTIGELLAETAGRWPQGPAAVFRSNGTRWTWRELDDEVTALCAGLQAVGSDAFLGPASSQAELSPCSSRSRIAVPRGQAHVLPRSPTAEPAWINGPARHSRRTTA